MLAKYSDPAKRGTSIEENFESRSVEKIVKGDSSVSPTSPKIEKFLGLVRDSDPCTRASQTSSRRNKICVNS